MIRIYVCRIYTLLKKNKICAKSSKALALLGSLLMQSTPLPYAFHFLECTERKLPKTVYQRALQTFLLLSSLGATATAAPHIKSFENDRHTQNSCFSSILRKELCSQL